MFALIISKSRFGTLALCGGAGTCVRVGTRDHVITYLVEEGIWPLYFVCSFWAEVSIYGHFRVYLTRILQHKCKSPIVTVTTYYPASARPGDCMLLLLDLAKNHVIRYYVKRNSGF